MKYSKGFKYKTEKTYFLKTNIVGYNVASDFLVLRPNGIITIKKGYAWDGASGIAPDTQNVMEASLVHDAFYEMMRWDMIPRTERKEVDILFKRICISAGMYSWIASIYYNAVNIFAAKYTTVSQRREIYEV